VLGLSALPVTPAYAASPIVTLPGTNPVTSVDGAAVFLDTTAALSDVDLPVDLRNGSLVVSVTGNPQTNDNITISAGGGITRTTPVGGAGTVSYGGNKIGDYSGHSTNMLTVIFTNDGFPTLAAIQALMRRIQFSNNTQPPEAAGTQRTVTYTVNDGTGAGSNGSAIKLVNVTSVNDVPNVTVASFSGSTPWTENAVPVQIDDTITINDVDWMDMGLSAPTMTFSLTGNCSVDDRLTMLDSPSIDIVSNDIYWTPSTPDQLIGSFSGGDSCASPLVITVINNTTTGALARMDEVMEAVYFSNVSENPSTANRTVSLTACDDTLACDATVETKTIMVTAANDAPDVVDIPDQTIAEGASFTTITLDDYVSDVDNTDVQMSWTYSGNTDLTVSIDPATRIATIGIPSANWTNAETITFRATDPGPLYDEDAATFTVTTINDAPAGTDNTVTASEDGSYTFAASDFGFTDPNDSPANVFNRVMITTLPSVGSLALSGSPVIAGDYIDIANIPSLVFTPVLNDNGSPYTSLTFQVEDNGGTANGGVNLDASANTMTINVTAVADAPNVSLPGTSPVTSIDGALVFLDTGAAVSDADNPANLNGGSLVVSITGNPQTNDNTLVSPKKAVEP